MKPEEGIVNVALGLGKTVVEGEKTLRFSPRYPQLLPQRSTVADILKNSQQIFYALKMGEVHLEPGMVEDANLKKRDISDAAEEEPLKLLASTYVAAEHRIRDSANMPGHRVLTFAQVLKYGQFPLAEILDEALALGREGMGCPVELEFSINMGRNARRKPEFAFLQLRPMTARAELGKVEISNAEIDSAFCVSVHALGNTEAADLADIVYVKPDVFDPGRTQAVALEIGALNARLLSEGRKYLLIGPGRWGSADRWLGIPVNWGDICGVGAIIEASSPRLKADPSQGSHFFHNITTLGITYVTVSEGDFIDWGWLATQPPADETAHVVHLKFNKPFVLKVDGRSSKCVIYLNS
jgi:hypothetical protein